MTCFLSPTTSAHPKILPPLKTDKACQLSLRLKQYHILLIDEVSMVDHSLFSWIDQRLQQLLHQSLPFGGMGIILMGDFLQLPPVFGSSLYKAALVGSTPGGLLFREFQLYTFTQHMRAAEDLLHTNNIDRFRSQSHPVNSLFLSNLKVLCSEDLINDPSWQFVPIVVTSNSERMAVSKVQVIRFGQMHHRPILTWHQPLAVTSTLQQKHQTILYENISELTGWFVEGAPAHLTSNIKPSKRLANGTEVILHSITLPREANISDIEAEISSALPGTIISLPCAPTSVNVIVPHINVICLDIAYFVLMGR